MRDMKEFYRSNTFLAIVSIVIAIVLWIYVVYEVNPMYETWIENIPVECINTSELFENGSLTIVGNNEKLVSSGATINVKIRGKRNVVSSVKKKDFTCTVDMISVSTDGKFNLKPSIEVSKSGIEIIKSDPTNFKLTTENVTQKDVKIELKKKGKLPYGHWMKEIGIVNKNVKVTGTTSVLNNLKRAEVLVDYSKLDVQQDSTTIDIVFYDSADNVIESSSFVNKSNDVAEIEYKIYTEKEVTINIVPDYANKVTVNKGGNTVKLGILNDDKTANESNMKKKVKLRGTYAALQKYTDSKKTIDVYTEEIDVSNIYSEKDFKMPVTLLGDIEFTTPLEVIVRATPEYN